MIINKLNKSYQTRLDMPNTNWMDDSWYLVADSSPLAIKVQQLFPCFDFVVNENGELIDIIEIEKTEEEIKQEKITEIDRELSDIDAQGVTRHLENIVEASGSYDTLYETTKALIDRKNELREQRKTLL
jgi:hypothetical protein